MRFTTNSAGSLLTQEGDFPFGEQWYESGPANKWVFTNYQRDSESGLDYASARYYDSRTGTFCSADPLAGDPSDPQSWNRYPYGRNNPITVTDPSGKSWLNWAALVGAFVADYFTFGVANAAFAAEGGSVAADPAILSADISVLGTVRAALGIQLRAPSQNLKPVQQKPVYCLPNVMDAMKFAYDIARVKNLVSQIHDPTKATEAGFPVYNTADGARVGNNPAGTPLSKQVGTGPADGWDPTNGRRNAIAVFHTHPDSGSGLPSSPGNTAGQGQGDTGYASTTGIDNYVISYGGLSVARGAGPVKPPKGWNPWIVQGNGIDDWLKKLKKLCGK